MRREPTYGQHGSRTRQSAVNRRVKRKKVARGVRNANYNLNAYRRRNRAPFPKGPRRFRRPGHNQGMP